MTLPSGFRQPPEVRTQTLILNNEVGNNGITGSYQRGEAPKLRAWKLAETRRVVVTQAPIGSFPLGPHQSTRPPIQGGGRPPYWAISPLGRVPQWRRLLNQSHPPSEMHGTRLFGRWEGDAVSRAPKFKQRAPKRTPLERARARPWALP